MSKDTGIGPVLVGWHQELRKKIWISFVLVTTGTPILANTTNATVHYMYQRRF